MFFQHIAKSFLTTSNQDIHIECNVARRAFVDKIHWNLNEKAMLRPSRVLIMKHFKLNCLEKGYVVNMLYDIAKMDHIALAFMLHDGKMYHNKWTKNVSFSSGDSLTLHNLQNLVMLRRVLDPKPSSVARRNELTRKEKKLDNGVNAFQQPNACRRLENGVTYIHESTYCCILWKISIAIFLKNSANHFHETPFSKEQIAFCYHTPWKHKPCKH